MFGQLCAVITYKVVLGYKLFLLSQVGAKGGPLWTTATQFRPHMYRTSQVNLTFCPHKILDITSHTTYFRPLTYRTLRPKSTVFRPPQYRTIIGISQGPTNSLQVLPPELKDST
jgi:hypothetical protein